MAKTKAPGSDAPKWNAKTDLPKLVEIATATLAGQIVYRAPADVAALVHLNLVEQNPAMVDEADATRYATRATAQGISESGVQAMSPQRMAETERNEANDAAAIAAQNGDTEMSDAVETVETAEPVKRKRGAPKGPRGPRPPIDLSGMVLGSTVGLPAPMPSGARGRRSVYPFADLAAPIGQAPSAQGQPDTRQFSRFFIPANETRPDPAKLLNATVNGHNKRLEKANAVDPATGKLPRFAIYRGEENGVQGAHVYRIQ